MEEKGEIMKKTVKDPCPECGFPLSYASGGGEVCKNCGYWFCY